MSDDRYPCIAMDPPWAERGGGKYKRGADKHYATLKPHEIIAATLASPLWRPAQNCHLWLWTTNNKLRDALLVMEALGFRYVTNVAWAKMRTIHDEAGELYLPQKPGIGQYLRGAHELLLFGVRGRLKGASRKSASLVAAPRRQHSQKPDLAFARIEEVSPGPRAELFATGPRAGWDCWRGLGHCGEEERVWSSGEAQEGREG